MNELQSLKQRIGDASFSPEAKNVINEILDSAEKRGSLLKEEKERIIGIIDLELEGGDIEMGFLKEVSAALEGFLGETERAVKEYEKDIEDIIKKSEVKK
jgi:hypothetical protein